MKLSVILNPDGLDVTLPYWCVMSDHQVVAMFDQEHQAVSYMHLREQLEESLKANDELFKIKQKTMIANRELMRERNEIAKENLKLCGRLATQRAALEFYATSINWDISLCQQDAGNAAASALAKSEEEK